MRPDKAGPPGLEQRIGRTFESFRAKRGRTVKYRFSAAPPALISSSRIEFPSPAPCFPLGCAGEGRECGFLYENRIECNAPTSITGKQGPLASPLAALERVASAVFFTENRIECNAPTSITGKKGPGWADVWRPALRALWNG